MSYVLTLAAIYIVALVIDALAPTFGGQKNPIQALKVAVYSGTAGWVAGIASLLPTLALLGGLVGGLYSRYLPSLGPPRLMTAPGDKAVDYTVVVVAPGADVFLFNVPHLQPFAFQG